MKSESINIGDFNEQITWKTQTSAKGSKGNTVHSYTEYKIDFAEVNPVNLGEAEIDKRIQYAQTYTFTTHFDAVINTKYQIEYNTEAYDIIRIEYLNLNRFMRTTAIKRDE